MTNKRKEFPKGIRLRPDNSSLDTEGEFKVDSADNKLKVKLNSSDRSVVTEDQSQTLTNKTIDADNNTISNLAHGAEVDNPSSGVHGVTGNVVGTTDTQTLTNKTIDGDDNTIQDLALTSLKTNITDASKFIVRDASGIPVSNTKDVPTGVVVGNSDTQTLTNKTISGSSNTISNLLHGTQVDNPSSGVHGVTGSVVGTTDTQTLTNKTISGSSNTISNLLHGTQVDNPSSGVHGVTGSIVGTTDTQTLTNKTIDGDNNTVQDLALTSLKTNVTDASKFLVRDGSGIVISNTKAVPSGTVVGTSDTQVLTAKDIDGGTASNTSRITLPKASTATLDTLTDKEATIAYDTDLDTVVYNDGVQWNALAASTLVTEYFSAYLSTDQVVSVSGVTKINFNAVEFDTQSGWNGGTFRYTIQTTGKYSVGLMIRTSSFITNEILTARVNINGSLRIVGSDSANGGNPSSICQKQFNLTAGDYIEFFGQSSTDASYSFDSAIGTGSATNCFVTKLIE